MCSFCLAEAKKYILAIINENYNFEELKQERVTGENQVQYQELIDYLLQSDAEGVNQSPRKSMKVERLSKLSKLNLFGLITLSEIVLHLKMTQDIGSAMQLISFEVQALRQISVQLLQLNSQVPIVGIASINIMEDFQQNLLYFTNRPDLHI